MMKQLTRTALAATLILSIAGAMLGTISYYDSLLNDKNSKIASMNSQIADLDDQVSNLQNQVANLDAKIANLTHAWLVTALGTNEVPFDFLQNPAPFSHLYTQGTVTNIGPGIAYDAGLHVVAYNVNGKVEVNMTVPLASMASFGTNTETVDYALKHYEGTDSLKLGDLLPTQTVNIQIQIFHERNVTSWDITPVWTNGS